MNVEGCEDAKADWEKGWAWAKYDPDKTNPEELVKAINENTAFEAKLVEKKTKTKQEHDSDPFSDTAPAVLLEQRVETPNGVAPLARSGR